MMTASHIRVSRLGRTILHDVSSSLPDGCITGIIGPNGAGKTTFLNVLYRAVIPDEGTVIVDGRSVEELSRREIARCISVVAQHSEATLPLTVRDSVALGMLGHSGALRYGSTEDAARVEEALERVDLQHVADRLTHELSGGEFQRVLIARAIVQAADHLLLDEPTNHLDVHHQYRILELVRRLHLTTTLVLHDLNLASQFCDRLILLHRGEVVAYGTPAEVLTAERVSEIYRVEASVVKHNGHNYLLFRSGKPTPSS
ncbi:Iron(3+)-hydroxamate import ATP-binding protein FhuC [Corynebacterium ciconiae DSM 44920]|uniref:ABC transporter ATP-binding protein n=1 Tax=Corynebacterium ciconiae TaxID=227319 RepID=UPI00037B71C3|nr:ABC transporter ATP-binding protein [Corynebacterium ciconiae]WKD60316.1 Iron(3+)-hydroxamate import ATP-binding protein FhuC [Corynebacterium ciconiae DSM 44920]